MTFLRRLPRRRIPALAATLALGIAALSVVALGVVALGVVALGVAVPDAHAQVNVPPNPYAPQAATPAQSPATSGGQSGYAPPGLTTTTTTMPPSSAPVSGQSRGQEAPLTGSTQAPGSLLSQPPPAAVLGQLPPFGAQLFQGQLLTDRTLSIGPDYLIAPGDRVSVSVWGAIEINESPTVDLQGNIFLPHIGPVRVGGVSNGSLDGVVRAAVQRVFTDQVQVYTNLQGTMPIGIYVTGKVLRPGRFAGDRTDSVLYYLARAGGIDPAAGSFRDIAVMRGGSKVAQIDLYAFLLTGTLPPLQFRDGDTIVVGTQGPTVSVYGAVANSYRFEFDPARATGADLAAIAQPDAKVSHVAVSGVRDGRLNTAYTPLDTFAAMKLRPGDSVRFEIDRVDETIFVQVLGQSEGSSIYTVVRGEKLTALLDQVAVDPALADTQSVYLRRKSVAERQQKALEDALAALQRATLTATSTTNTEAEIRVREAEMVERFLSRVRAVPMEGRVVLAGAALDQVRLEPEDVVVIPQKTQVVLVSGEVTMPQSVLHRPGMTVSDVVAAAGGYTDYADSSAVLVIRPSGAVETGSGVTLGPGDHVMVMPKPDDKNFAIFKDIVGIIYQVAVGAGILIRAY